MRLTASLALSIAAWISSAALKALGNQLINAKNRPVTKVITLLKDMLNQLEKEAAGDEEIYDKMACWCETNDREKTEAIAGAESRISVLTTKIEETSASSARLNTEIKTLKKEVAANQKALDQATQIRQTQLAEFNGEEKDLLESISALKAAITVLAKHHDSFLQVNTDRLVRAASILSEELTTNHAGLFASKLSKKERSAAASFIQAPQDYFDATPTFKQSYAPQSGEIFGILKQMKETFEKNLGESQKEESANQKTYEELKAAKVSEIEAGQAQIDSKTQELADADEKLAQSKQDLEDTKKSLSEDEQFLMMLKEKCQMTDKEWEERSKTRQLEMEAVSKALAVLSNDDAHDLFTRTFSSSLIQANSMRGGLSAERRSKASGLLEQAARKHGNEHLAALAVKVRLDAFTRVKKAIDDMIAQLIAEKADEIKHKHFCVDEFSQNQLQTVTKNRDKEDETAKIEDLEMSIDKLKKEIDNLKNEIEEMQVQLKRAGEDREKQNKEFQTTVADQRETQKLLKAALSILGSFYGEADAAFLQEQEPVGPPQPAGFEKYKKSAASGDVMSTIEKIISDAKTMEADTIRAEEEMQKAYEDFVKDSHQSIEAKSNEIANKSDIKAKDEADLIETKQELDSTITELEQLGNYKTELHQSCDFVMKNFDSRQKSRDEEIEALKQANVILSGEDFEAFVQEH